MGATPIEHTRPLHCSLIDVLIFIAYSSTVKSGGILLFEIEATFPLSSSSLQTIAILEIYVVAVVVAVVDVE